MSKIDENIIEYDTGILKGNIKDLMKEKHITQAALASNAKMEQSRISAILSGKSSDCFTVPQLVYIARTLNVSTDALLGIETTKESEHELCMSEICSKLFEIDNMFHLKIGTCKMGEYRETNDYTNEIIETEVPGIYFNNQPLSDFLKEWNEIASSSIGRKETKTKVLELWKAETLKDADGRKSKWNFRTEQEQANLLTDHLLEEYHDYCESQCYCDYAMQYLSGTWLESELKLIEENTNPASPNYSEVIEAIKVARRPGFCYIPDEIR